MARPVRVQFSGALYPVTARSNERRRIFRDDRDRPARVPKYLSQYLSADAQARSAWGSANCRLGLSAIRPRGVRCDRELRVFRNRQ
jgi:hypothetical protein